MPRKKDLAILGGVLGAAIIGGVILMGKAGAEKGPSFEIGVSRDKIAVKEPVNLAGKLYNVASPEGLPVYIYARPPGETEWVDWTDQLNSPRLDSDGEFIKTVEFTKGGRYDIAAEVEV